MTTVYDVPAKELIDEVANKLRDNKSIKLPEQNTFSKTSVARENPPDNRAWWYIRCASILRKIYIHGPIGVEVLRREYGGKKDRGSKPYKARGGSASIIRRALQQLEEAGYISKVRGKGRRLTPKGQSFLDNTAYEVLQKVKDKYPGLEKY